MAVEQSLNMIGFVNLLNMITANGLFWTKLDNMFCSHFRHSISSWDLSSMVLFLLWIALDWTFAIRLVCLCFWIDFWCMECLVGYPLLSWIVVFGLWCMLMLWWFSVRSIGTIMILIEYNDFFMCLTYVWDWMLIDWFDIASMNCHKT